MQDLPTRVGERLLITTDGVAEAMSPQGDLFGRETLDSIITDCRNQGLEKLIEEVAQALREHQDGEAATDDTTILAVEFVPEAGKSCISQSRRACDRASGDQLGEYSDLFRR